MGGVNGACVKQQSLMPTPRNAPNDAKKLTGAFGAEAPTTRVISMPPGKREVEKRVKKSKWGGKELSDSFHFNSREDVDGLRASMAESSAGPENYLPDHRLDINSVSAEELMTLPGIDRFLAENVVRHRERIGGFRFLEDLAVVSGFGAAKVNAIRREITLKPPKLDSRRSSPLQPATPRKYRSRRISTSCSPSLLNFEPSFPFRKTVADFSVAAPMESSSLSPGNYTPQRERASIPYKLSASECRPFHRRTASGPCSSAGASLDVNRASLKQLMTVPRLSQSLAQRICLHRLHFGEFDSVEELLRIKGIDASFVEDLKPFLCATPRESSIASSVNDHCASSSQRDDSGICDGTSKTSAVDDVSVKSDTASLRHARDSASVAFKTTPRPQSTSIIDLVPRRLSPSVVTPFDYRRGDKKVFRVASWNLQSCGNAKISNVGVTDVVVMTTLESGLAILALQDLRDVNVVEHLCSELNDPSLPVSRGWAGARGNWRSTVSHARDRRLVGFLYDSAQNMKLVKAKDYECPLGGAILSRATFRLADGLKAFSIVNAFFYSNDPDKTRGALATLRDALHETAASTRNSPVVVVSDVAYPRKSIGATWEVLRLKQLLAASSARFAAGAALVNNELAVDGSASNSSFDSPSMVERIGENVSTSLLVSNSSPTTPARGGDALGGPFVNPTGSNGDRLKIILTLSSPIIEPEVNLSMDARAAALYSGFGAVVVEGLTSPWIPESWDLKGRVSSRRPIWAEFFRSSVESPEDVTPQNRRERFRASMPAWRLKKGRRSTFLAACLPSKTTAEGNYADKRERTNSSSLLSRLKIRSKTKCELSCDPKIASAPAAGSAEMEGARRKDGIESHSTTLKNSEPKSSLILDRINPNSPIKEPIATNSSFLATVDVAKEFSPKRDCDLGDIATIPSRASKSTPLENGVDDVVENLSGRLIPVNPSDPAPLGSVNSADTGSANSLTKSCSSDNATFWTCSDFESDVSD